MPSIDHARQPFPEQIAAFRLRLGRLLPTARWTDVMRHAHDRAFVVAGAAKADLLADFGAAVDQAVSAGESLQKFRARFDEIVDRHGWAYRGERNWRTRVIYRTNISTTYAAGRLAQLQHLPIWVYRHSGAEHPRLQHKAWDGLTLPADHAFWETHSPPNGWGCGCRLVGARTRDGARRLGGDPDYSEPPEGWDVRDSEGRLPGIDYGWDYQPGGTVIDTVRALAPKLDQLPRAPSVAVIQSWLAAAVFARWFAAPQGSWPLARLPDADARGLGAAEGVRVAHLSSETAGKQQREHPEMTPAEYARAQEVIDRHTGKAQDGNSLIYVRELPEDGEAGGHVLVVKVTRSGRALWTTSFRRLSREQAMRESEIRRLLRKGETG